MKKTFLPVFICAMITLYTIHANGQNTKLGTNALAHNTSGNSNTAIGYYSMFTNTTGSNNAAVGANSLYANTSGNHNTAIGFNAIRYNTTGIHNTANGAYAMYSNTTGSSNTASGFDALFNNSTGSNNTADGMYSLNKNTNGALNTGTGYAALYTNTSGSNNIANGAYSLNKNTTGWDNTANGTYTLYTNTSGSSNTALGYAALFLNSSASFNTAVGYSVLYFNTASSNSGFGNYSLFANTTGNSNTGVGIYSLYTNTTGSNNTAIGDSADVSTGALKNATAIGYKAIVDKSNKVRVGNTSVTSIGGQVGWTTYSDGRFKKDIKENVPGLVFINSLRPITYTVNVKGINEFYNKGRKSVSANNIAKSEDKVAKAEIEKSEEAAAKIVYNGFIAQEVETAANKLSFAFSGVDKPETIDGLYGLRYDNFIAPLVKAVQELSKIDSAKDDQIKEQDVRINDLTKRFENLEAQVSAFSNTLKTGQNISLADATTLGQNTPNPFSKSTAIHYVLPQKFTTAQIIIVDQNGKVLKAINVNAAGSGTLNVDASILSSGAYSYSLVVDGRLTDTKQMLLAK